MRLGILGAAAAALVSAGSPMLLAKSAPTPGPKPGVKIWGYAEQQYHRDPITDRETARQGWVIARTGSEKGDTSTWLSPSDQAFALMKRNPALQARARLMIAFNAEGMFDHCIVEEERGAPELLNGLCDRLRLRARMFMPMTRDGQHQAENLKLTVEFRPQPGLMVPPPVITPVAPSNWWNGRAPYYVPYLVNVAGLPTVADPKAIKPGLIETGVTVQLEDGRPVKCTVGMTTGDSATGEQACALAIKAAYAAERGSRATVHVPIIFVGTGSEMNGMVPLHRSNQPAKILPAAKAALAALVAKTDPKASIKPVVAQAYVDAKGEGIDCWLTESSGSDRADLKICDYLMEGRHFDPGEDIFGRPAAMRLHYLELGETPR